MSQRVHGAARTPVTPLLLQMGSFFVAQGVKMDRTIALPGGGSFVMPAASLA
jgi:hypothetical protein